MSQEESYIYYYKLQSEDKQNTYEYRACSELKTKERFFRFYWLTLEDGWTIAQKGVNQDLGNVDNIPQPQIEKNNLVHVITTNWNGDVN
jgi:hypothetical protein